MPGYPTSWSFLPTTDRNQNQEPLKPFWRSEASMCQQTVVTNRNTDGTKNPSPENERRDAGPAKKPRHKHQQRQHMHHDERNNVAYIDTLFIDACRKRKFRRVPASGRNRQVIFRFNMIQRIRFFFRLFILNSRQIYLEVKEKWREANHCTLKPLS